MIDALCNDRIKTIGLLAAKGAGKSTFLGGLVAGCLTEGSPLYTPRAEVVIVCGTTALSTPIVRQIEAFLPDADRVSEGKRSNFRVVRTSGTPIALEDKRGGVLVRILSGLPHQLHGLRPTILIGDECSWWPSTRAEELMQLCLLGLGKNPGAKGVFFSTAGPDERGAFMRRMDSTRPDRFNLRLRYQGVDYGSDRQRMLSWQNIKRANPGIAHKPSLSAQLKIERKTALLDDQSYTAFKALRLNLGGSLVDAQNLVVRLEDWQEIEVGKTQTHYSTPDGRDKPLADGPMVLGVDLASGSSMTAFAGYYPWTGYLRVCAFYGDSPSLQERERRVGLGHGTYSAMCVEGSLFLCAGKVVSPHDALEQVESMWGLPTVIIADRYKERELSQVITDMGLTDAHFVSRGTGYKSASEDLQLFRQQVLTKQLRPARSLLMTHALEAARVSVDSSGNEKVAGSSNSRGYYRRYDPVSASVIAVAEGVRRLRAQYEHENTIPVLDQSYIIKRH